MKPLRLRPLRLLLLNTLIAAGLAGSPALAAEPGFLSVPGPKAGESPSPVKLKVVGYGGHTNGEMVVEVFNDSPSKASFDPSGLYFVPQGDPETAPQRLGATGPFEVSEGAGWQDSQSLELAPGERKKVKLQVFCIDSHRPSPSPSTPFALASERMPSALRGQVEQGTSAILKANTVGNAKYAKGEVQGYIWQTRDSNWVPLEGERKAEKASKGHSQGIQQELNVAPQLESPPVQQRRK